MAQFQDIGMDSLSFIINHVFLPPKLPQEAENNRGEGNAALLKVVRDIAESYHEKRGQEKHEQWAPAVKMLERLGQLENNSALDAEAFRTAVRSMERGDVLALHIRAQNAGLILRQLKNTMLFESFEASPLTGSVIGTIGKLRCSYPGPAIYVSLAKVKKPAFLEELGIFLEKMSRDVLEQASCKVTKAGSIVEEDRETQSPQFITQLLTGILRGIGTPAAVQRIEKRIADDVLFDNARTPWRRSPLWLIVRVALQTTLGVPGEGHKEYKAFMVFLMARLLDWALSMDDVPSDILFIMNAKLSRRVHKMRNEVLPHFALVEARRVCELARDTLDKRWTEAQQYYSRPFDWDPASFLPERDVKLSMNNTKDYLRLSSSVGLKQGNLDTFTPSEFKRIHTSSSRLPELASFKGSPDKEIVLADFELWVSNNLGKWFDSIQDRRQACERLGEEIEDYISAGKLSASSSPVRNSVFILTMMELWVALDKITLMLHPLLSRQNPGFGDGLLTHLLLPQAQQRIRLHNVEEYLRTRKSRAHQGTADLLYSDQVTDRSFAVQYFDNSTDLQRLRRQILDNVQKDLIRKESELESKETEYYKLLRAADRLSCGCVPRVRWEEGRTEYRELCKRCSLIDTAERIRIERFENPLPEEPLAQKAVVFELRCPLGFSIWRDMTFKVLTELCPPPAVPPGDIDEVHETLDTYSGLQRYSKGPQRCRSQKLQWSSYAKPFLKCHYRFARLPTTMASIRVNHGLRYGLYDSEGQRWTDQAIGVSNVQKLCTFRLPDPYRKLQYTLGSTTHTPNTVISRQSECPVNMQLHEYIAFGLVRSGHRVQWLNMLRELRSRTLRFNNDAVNMLFSQCAWQAGPRGLPECPGVLRESHVDLKDEEFGRSLLSELGNFLATIESNWQEVVATQTLIMLAVQLLSFATNKSIKTDAVKFLRDARRVCSGWTRELSTKLRECKHEEMKELTIRIVQVAAVCRETYNVEQEHLRDVLNSRKDIAVLVECAIIIHDNAPAIRETSTRQICSLLDRDRRLSHAIEAHLRSLIQTDRVGLDLTCVWSAYKPKSSWKSLAAPNTRWMFVTTGGSEDRSQKVYYNLLTGKLLVDGLPLAKLPLDYVSHQTYKELFDEVVLDVLPAKMHGMMFEAKQPMEGHDVGFVMHGKELIIRIRRITDSVVHQLIPRAGLHGDFPGHIIANYLYWLELSTNKIELRDRSTPWKPENSRYISDTYSSTRSVLHLGADQRLIDVRSATTAAINLMLGPLEQKGHITVCYGKDGVVSAHLPRLKLDFFINLDGRLECRQFQGMVVDCDPNIGTLTGLENRLVVSQGSVRSVLIPYGKVRFEQFNNHVRVEIDTRGRERVKYHIYTIDTILGRLVGNGSLASHLYKIYLHAVTASCLPDTLTSRTGTEEALYLLRAAATWSFQKPEIEGEEAELFGLIQSLTPARVFYPKIMGTMQTVTWSSLSPIAQHDEFASIVGDVLSHARRFQMFGGGGAGSSPLGPTVESSDPSLLKRAAHRNASFRTYEFGGSSGEEKMDDVYEARDILQKTSMHEARVCYISALVERWPSRLNVCLNLMDVFEKWGVVGGKRIDFVYDQEWLDQDLAEVWFELYQSLTVSTRERHTYRLIFLLGAIAYSGETTMDLIETLLAFSTVDRFRSLGLPISPSYNLNQGCGPDLLTLDGTLKGCSTVFEHSDEYNQRIRVGESESEHFLRRYQAYSSNLEEQSTSFITEMFSQWPSATPYQPAREFPLLDTSTAIANVTVHFRNWHKNQALQRHVHSVQDTLKSVNIVEKRIFQIYTFHPCRGAPSSVSGAVPLENLLRKPHPDLPLPPPPTSVGLWPVRCDSEPEATLDHSALESLLRGFETSENLGGFWGIYVTGLRRSFKALQDLPASTQSSRALVSTRILESCEAECKKYMMGVFGAIRERLLPKRNGKGWMIYRAGLWPRISPMLILQQLATNRAVKLTDRWRTALVTYGKTIAMLQRLQRLLKHYRAGASSELYKELENSGHSYWNQTQKTDWLLMEIENSLLVRPVQVDIASRMISPHEGQNTLMQLCMGEGKTSIIVPIAAAYLANRERLVRVVVLKPLIGQMFQTLVQRLGGLVNRRIYFLPFSRRVKMGLNEARLVHSLFEECMKNGGILLAQPEHILSFKLLGLERLYNAEELSNNNKPTRDMKELQAVAQQLLETQRWLRKKSRDILDESDEILSIRHELIYTIGSSKSIEGYPDRWIIIQQILDLIREHLSEVEFNPRHFEVVHSTHDGGFDSVRILDISAGRSLLKTIASRIIAGHLPAFPFRFLPEHLLKVAKRFITDPALREEEWVFLRLHYQDNQAATCILYLLRGLIAHNLLLYVLHYKRWKVDYGLDPSRSRLAVPYRAKDSPSGQSEFSHPDVAITLTCLSYYYGGLSEDQLEICFRDVYKSDNPTMEFERWLEKVSATNHNFKLRHLSAINLEDRNQWKKEILPTFKYNKAVIDFYLSGVVFPMEAKEFSVKLSTSGWDIAEKKEFEPMTGFSGTNDNQYLLPLSITQRDTEEQLNTNARVLSYLLQPENCYKLADGPSGERLAVEQLLEFITDSEKSLEVTVLLDVGAQVLELRNNEVAREWLKLVPESCAKAAVYFNDTDELTVVARDGTTEPLMISAFAERLDACLVYLDEAHTRGTDLKLPSESRAVVTLGPNMTKDRLVQACMRMRKLGNGHSVVFCGPPEVDRKIREIAKLDHSHKINVRDVLHWCMMETCGNARRLLPIWAKQGISHTRRYKACNDLRLAFPQSLLEQESKSLEEYYGPKPKTDILRAGPSTRKTDGKGEGSEFNAIWKKCKEFGVRSFGGAPMLEEQERELSHEIECERVLERPPKVEPSNNQVTKGLKELVDTGHLPPHSRRWETFIPAFRILRDTSAKPYIDLASWPETILVTHDFATVVDKRDRDLDEYLRPVNWILSMKKDPSTLIILSSYEVNELLPSIRPSKLLNLHMYSARTAKANPSYETLDFCTIPRLPKSWQPNMELVDSINIFAGQVYFLDYETYERVCGFLGLYSKEHPQVKYAAIGSDGFVEPSSRKLLSMRDSTFEESPVPFVRTLVGMRRKRQNYVATHMGQMLNGRILSEGDFAI